MTATAEDIFDQAARDAFDVLGRPATFTPATGDPVTLQVSLEQEVDFQPAGEAAVWETGATIEYVLEDLGREADPGETFTIDTTVYTVKSVIENDGRFIRVAVK